MTLFMKQLFKKRNCLVMFSFLAYLGQFKSKFPIQGHFWKLENKGFHLAPRFMGFYPLLVKILAPEKKKHAEVCLHSLYSKIHWYSLQGSPGDQVIYSI